MRILALLLEIRPQFSQLSLVVCTYQISRGDLPGLIFKIKASEDEFSMWILYISHQNNLNILPTEYSLQN